MFDQETWRFVNTFAPWLSAFGTIAAVITSLYFSRKDKRISLQVFADYRSVLRARPGLDFLVSKRNKDAVVVYVTNVGHRDAVVELIFWKHGVFRRKVAIQNMMDNEWTSTIPKRIKDGEVAHYCFVTENDYDWVKDVGSTFVGKFPWIESFFIKVQVRTSIGKKFEARIGSELRQAIVAEAKKRD